MEIDRFIAAISEKTAKEHLKRLLEESFTSIPGNEILEYKEKEWFGTECYLDDILEKWFIPTKRYYENY